MPRSWLAKWEAKWPKEDRLAIGTAVTYGNVSGYTIQGYDFANRRYRILKVVADPPSRSDLTVGEGEVIIS